MFLLSKSFIHLGKLQRQLLWQCFRYRRRPERIINPDPQIAVDKQLLAQQRHQIGKRQGTVADRVVFPCSETIAASKNLCGDFGSSVEDATLDSTDRHAAGEVPTVEVDLYLFILVSLQHLIHFLDTKLLAQ